MSVTDTTAPPRENLVRAVQPTNVEMRDASGDGMPTLTGHFSVFNEWTEINSMWEGNFLERISPGAFKKTMQENRDGMRVLFQHGKDPQIGEKVLGTIDALREDASGAFYEVPLFDTSYNRDLLPGLQAGVYGASFRFSVMREDVVTNPAVSDFNPQGLPERTIKEARVREFGPVTWGAYPTATAGIRSLTDELMISQLLDDPEQFRHLLEDGPDAVRDALTALAARRDQITVFLTKTPASVPDEQREEAPVEPDAAPVAPSAVAPRPDRAPTGTSRYLTQKKEKPSWQLTN